MNLPANAFIDSVDLSRLASPIEEEFYRVISKYLSPKVELQNQYLAKAGGYNFSVDFVILIGTSKIGIECDGKEFHDVRKDEWRDNLILKASVLDSIVRVRGTDINFRMPDALFAMAQWYPDIFSPRGMDNIHRLTTQTARETPIGNDVARYVYNPHEETQNEELDSDEVVDDKFAGGFGELRLFRKEAPLA